MGCQPKPIVQTGLGTNALVPGGTFPQFDTFPRLDLASCELGAVGTSNLIALRILKKATKG